MAPDTMTNGTEPPYFSVIISTRNRATLFEKALQSVASQTFSRTEIIVVVDGSDEIELEKYRCLHPCYPNSQFHYLVHRPNGHGQSYSMNYGAAQAKGTYLCFLDDDDYWTDNEYLARAHDSLSNSDETVDVHYSNQCAFFSDGTQQLESVWLEDLNEQVHSAQAHRNDTYFVDADFLMQSGGFGHLNCSAFNREFYNSIKGMDETIRYENDRDMFLRGVDNANRILFSTHTVSRHHIPDAHRQNNMSTIAPAIEKKLYQLRVYDKGICMSKQRCVIEHCMRGKTYELKHIVRILSDNGDLRGAAHYARAALPNGFNLRWLGYTVFLTLKSLFR